MQVSYICAVIGFVVVLCSIDYATAACNWNNSIPCLTAISGGGGRSNKANLTNIVDSFEAGLTIRCNMLKTLLTCMGEATKDCRPEEDSTNRFKIIYTKMTPVIDYFCVKNIQKFLANQNCMKTQALKSGMLECQKIIDRQEGSCSMFKDTITCADQILYTECEPIHHEVGHVLRMYIGNVMNLENCQIPEHVAGAHNHVQDHDHSAHSTGAAVSNQFNLLTVPTLAFLGSRVAARIVTAQH